MLLLTCPICSGTDLDAIHGSPNSKCATCGMVVSPAIILTVDPDPEEPMTTIPIPDPIIVDRAGTQVLPRDAADINLLIRRTHTNPVHRDYVQKAKGGEGTGTLGLYLEAVTFTAAGSPFTHMRFFVVDKHVYAYSRSAGDSRANWRHRNLRTLLNALETVQTAIDKPNVRLFGHPVLVELTADDLSAIEADQPPPARFRGVYRIEHDYGRYDFKIEVISSPVPIGLVELLRKGFTALPAPTE